MNNLYSCSIIVAQCTPNGQGALALVRLTGDRVFELVDNMCVLPAKKKITNLPTHSVQYGTVVDINNEPIDHVLFFKMDAPHTFTGLDTVEITCHNNIFIVNALIENAINHGARIAEPGEFTKLAFLNKKIDLVQAESIDELIHATSLAHAKSALKQLEGSFSASIDNLEQQLLHLLTLCAASFEFIEEENIDFTQTIQKQLSSIIEDIARIEKNFDAQIQLKEGFKIAFIGCVNAGKSSLFNAMLEKKRAIVNEKAGTTRDTIEATISKNGYYWTLIDTAGLRTTHDVIEQEGISKSLEQAILADVLLLVYDSSRVLSTEEEMFYNKLIETHEAKIIKVYNKNDQEIPFSYLDGIGCSALYNKGIDELTTAINKKINALTQKNELPFLVNKRHILLLQTVKAKIADVVLLCNKEKIAYELVSCQLHDILVQLSEFSGNTINEKIMDRVFETFCVGK
ncbi:tRNA uridine-5-carboxymethylaminomethyl(34) synthesis GTPase MnmE [Candidatus Dependentiae bacterium]|nr:MAG: tRNA uridine-5-carboxymethylaminomethyl(34) synthesis GTPase MnmE [Candidatus Dependentiae bacterium]